MPSQDTIRLTAQFFRSHLPALQLTKQRKIAADGTYFHAEKAIFQRLYEMLGSEDKKELLGELKGDFVDFQTSADVARQLESQLKAVLSEGAIAAVDTDYSDVFLTDSIKTPLSGLKLVTLLDERRKVLVYDVVKDLTHEFDHAVFREALARALEDDTARAVWLARHTEHCKLSYVPFKSPRLFYDAKTDTKYFNLWQDAAWREGWVPDPAARCPTEIDEFLAHFARDDESAYYLKAWLRDCCFERAEPILILCGIPGTGKNIFVDTIARTLVGKDNAHSASRGFNDSKFHANVANCRLFFQDEMSLTPTARETLKSYHNGTGTLEFKGKDVKKAQNLYASFVLANNHPHMIKLEYSDRKFYVPLLSEKPLLESWGQEAVHGLIAAMTDHDYVRQLASYLFFNFKPQEATHFPKNDFFRKLCVNSYPPVFRQFIRFCEMKPEFTEREFKTRALHDYPTMLDLVSHYEASFRERLADLSMAESGKWIARSHVYRGPSLGEEAAGDLA